MLSLDFNICIYYRFDSRALRWALTMRLAIDQINNSTVLLPNHTLGYRIFDSCATPVTAQRAVLAVLNDEDVGQGSLCNRGGPLLAIVGESGSSQSIVVSRTLQPFRIPMVKGDIFVCTLLSQYVLLICTMVTNTSWSSKNAKGYQI